MNMNVLRRRTMLMWSALAASGQLGVANAQGSEWPSKPIKLIVPTAPGAATDIMGRLLADHFKTVFKVPVVVENRAGATGTIALNTLAKSPADGYTIGIGFSAANVLMPLLRPNLPFDAQKDLLAVGQLGSGGGVLVVSSDLPVKSLKELIALAKSQPKGQPLAYASWGNGSGGNLAGEALKVLSGIDMLHVPYASTPAVTTALLGGHVKVGFLDIGAAKIQANNEKLRFIAHTTFERSAAFPSLPTMKEEGVDFGFRAWFGLFAPAGTPEALIRRLSDEVNVAIRQPVFEEKLETLTGFKTQPVSSDAFRAIIKEDFASLRALLSKVHINLE